jgi:peptidoglycan/LPS O-acetylase OafA/YrhL
MSRDVTPHAPALPYWPAIDGLRAVAVVSVLFFHAGFSWAAGGYLGVSTFFTLSGFLITSLLLTEREATGRIDTRAFWSRRFRRLLPAALAALALAVLYGATVADAEQIRELRGDILACLAYVANWRFLFSEQSYADLFATPSPVLHFWSLAIEEQFYLLFPLLALGIFRWGHGSRQVFTWVIGGLIAASLGLALFFGLSHDRIYYGTDTRAAELLLGALLAAAVTGRTLPRAARAGATIGGPIALVFMVVAMSTVEQSTDALYHGGFVAYGVASTLVVLAATLTTGPVVSALSLRPLVALGKISYGVYLYHWIVYQWLTPRRTGLTGSGWEDAALFALRVAVTLALAAASYVLLEQPIRRRQAVRGRAPFVVTPAAIGALLVAVLVVTVSPPPPLIDFAAAQEAQDAGIDPLDPDAVTVDPDAPLPDPPPPRIAMFGDSTAGMTAVGLLEWMDATGAAANAGNSTFIGCGVGRGGQRVNGPDGVSEADENCDRWAEIWPSALEAGQPDLAVIQIGPWDATDRKIEGDDTWRAPGDPVYDEYLRAEMREATDVLASTGAEVVWLSSPAIGPGENGDAIEIRGDAADPLRMARLNEIMAEVVAERPGDAHVVDLAGWLTSTGDDVRLRPDGVHFSEATSGEVAREFLGPALVELHRRTWIDDWVAQHGPPVPEPLRVMTVGDSTAMMVGFGLANWNAESGALVPSAQTAMGCGAVIEPAARYRYQGREWTVGDDCARLWSDWETAVETFDPHVVVMLTGPFDVADHLLPGDSVWRAPGDPVYDAYLAERYRAATEILSANGALVVWLSSPHIETHRGIATAPPEGWSESEPGRIDRVNDLIAAAVEADDHAVLVDFAGHLASYPGGELDPRLRPDGIHLSTDPEANATDQVGAWLGPELLDRYGTWVTGRWVAGTVDDRPAPRPPTSAVPTTTAGD